MKLMNNIDKEEKKLVVIKEDNEPEKKEEKKIEEEDNIINKENDETVPKLRGKKNKKNTNNIQIPDVIDTEKEDPNTEKIRESNKTEDDKGEQKRGKCGGCIIF